MAVKYTVGVGIRGMYQCPICHEIWNAEELYPSNNRMTWTCGDLFCGANVERFIDEQEPETAES